MKPELLPSRLYSRLVLLITGSLLAIFLLTITVIANDRTQAFFLAQQAPLMGRMERLLPMLETAGQQQRLALITRFSAPAFRIMVGSQVTVPGLAEGVAPAPDEVNRFMDAFTGLGRDYEWQLRKFPGRAESGEPDRMTAVTRLQDGTAVAFNYGVPQPPVSVQNAWLALASVCTGVILLSLLLGRWLLAPFMRLVSQAEALGKSLDIPPLEVTGPEEARTASTALNRMQERLLNLEQQRKQILSAVSHDLKTPITRMLLRTEFMADAAMADKFTHDLHEMEYMINETLGFIRAEGSQEEIVPVDLGELLTIIIDEFAEMGHEVSLDAAAVARTLLLQTRPLMLKRCLANLIGNGLKYGRQVQCNFSEQGGQVLVCISDSGPGLPESQLEKVFEPYYRLEPSRNRASGGHGLGLSICRQIAESLGGRVWLENRPGGGLQANLQLPTGNTAAPTIP